MPDALAQPQGKQPVVASARWARLEQELAHWLVERLKIFRQPILAVDQAVRQLTQELEA